MQYSYSNNIFFKNICNLIWNKIHNNQLLILLICYCFIRLFWHSKLKTYTEICYKYLKAQVWKTNDLILFQNNLPNTSRTVPFHPNPPEWSFGWLLGNNIPASAHVYPLPYTGKDVFVPVSSCASSLTVLVCRHRTFCEGGVRLEKQIHFLGLFVYYLLLVRRSFVPSRLCSECSCWVLPVARA